MRQRREQGQALPLALAVLGLAGVVVAPFLAHVGTGLTSLRVERQLTSEAYSADAGVEHAIWRLTSDSLGNQIPFADDSIAYQPDHEVNGTTPHIAVTNVSGPPRPLGDILEPEMDTLEFDPSAGNTPDILAASGDIYAIAYEGPHGDGFLATVRIAANGLIGNEVVDALEFDASRALAPVATHVSGNVYAVAYGGPGKDGFVSTLQISPDGQIANSVIDTLEFDTSLGQYPSITRVQGNVFAIAYEGSRKDGYLATVAVAADGQITDAVVDRLEFDTRAATAPCIVAVDDDVFAIAYQGPKNHGVLKTVGIAADGQITDAVIDSWEFDSLTGRTPSMLKVSGDVYSVAYRGPGGDGHIKTFVIEDDGQMAGSAIDTEVFERSNGKTPSLLPVASDAYVLAYRGPGNGGYLRTVEISDSGAITDGAIDTFEFHTANGWTPDIAYVAGDIYALAYTGAGGDGFVRTVDIETDEVSPLVYEIVSVAGDITIRARVRITGSLVEVLSWMFN